MSIEQWWPKLRPSTREWLIENNGDAVPAEIVAEITAAGGSIASDGWWVGQSGPSGFYISDEAADRRSPMTKTPTHRDSQRSVAHPSCQ